MRRNIPRDPYWTTARYSGECRRCKAPIKRGDRIWWYPNGRAAYCAADACGQACSAEFSAAAADEAISLDRNHWED